MKGAYSQEGGLKGKRKRSLKHKRKKSRKDTYESDSSSDGWESSDSVSESDESSHRKRKRSKKEGHIHRRRDRKRDKRHKKHSNKSKRKSKRTSSTVYESESRSDNNNDSGDVQRLNKKRKSWETYQHPIEDTEATAACAKNGSSEKNMDNHSPDEEHLEVRSYSVGLKRTSPSNNKLSWYEGYQNIKKTDPSETDERIPVSIICVEDKFTASNISQCFKRLKPRLTDEDLDTPHARLWNLRFTAFSNQLNSHIVAYDRFDCYLRDALDEGSGLSKKEVCQLQNPLNPSQPSLYKDKVRVPRNPRSYLRRMMSPLVNQLGSFHLANVSSSNINEKGIVWVSGQPYFILVDTLLDDIEDDRERNRWKLLDILDLGKVMAYLLSGEKKEWLQRNDYLSSFSLCGRFDRRMYKAISTQKFLSKDIVGIFEFFHYVHVAHKSKQFGNRPGYDVENLYREFRNTKSCFRIFKDGTHWDDRIPSDCPLYLFLRYKPKVEPKNVEEVEPKNVEEVEPKDVVQPKNAVQYDRKRLDGLVNVMANIYKHGHEKPHELDLVQCYILINHKYFPGFVDMCHLAVLCDAGY